MAAALSDYGVIMLPEWVVQGAMDAGRLVRVLPDHKHGAGAIPIHAVFAHRLHLPAKTRVFVDFMAEKMRAKTWARY